MKGLQILLTLSTRCGLLCSSRVTREDVGLDPELSGCGRHLRYSVDAAVGTLHAAVVRV
ncbi:hypothetical protein PR003_g15779 [Phytophthora rubi]|uniref:Uncharacterized protein n=1 Tax=Phytophthora rubi TaxID=129364 RepID=A0A6A3KV01_9STRA|nr:hypothetical protein PR002_g15640 [Phytophthora rubi]KAE9015945.1 hypothetical protein PR001_g14774 [Phytophthora rubi]KAE9328465.1 hypothetical protein PR003_g15779 [Phytophthora rubi]